MSAPSSSPPIPPRSLHRTTSISAASDSRESISLSPLPAHDAKVQLISTQVTHFHRSGVKWHIYHGSTNSTRPQHSFTHSNTVDISGLNNIIGITTSKSSSHTQSHLPTTTTLTTNAKPSHFQPSKGQHVNDSSLRRNWAATALVEPNVPMDKLVTEMQNHDLLPPVVPEFPGITVGGALAGTAGESSSFKYGFFESCVVGVEVVLGDGRVVWAGGGSQKGRRKEKVPEKGKGEGENGDGVGVGGWDGVRNVVNEQQIGDSVEEEEGDNEDLFEALKGTFGTLGIVTLVEIGLIYVPKGSVVLVQYNYVNGLEEILDQMEELGVGSAQNDVADDERTSTGEVKNGVTRQGNEKIDRRLQRSPNDVPTHIEYGTILDECAKKEQPDFIDAILFSSTHGCLITGTLISPTHALQPQNRNKSINTPRLLLTTFTNPWDPWFYLHAQSATTWSQTTSQPYTELVPLIDYLFRYDRGAFWMGRYAFEYFLTSFNVVTRALLDGFMRARVMYHALHRSGPGVEGKFLVQDLAVPVGEQGVGRGREGAGQFYSWVKEELGIWPIWLCPIKAGKVGLNPHGMNNRINEGKGGYLLNFGVWGRPRDGDVLQLNRELESKLREVKGIKWLYAKTFYEEQEFWSIYDKEWYEEVRRKFKAEGLPSVWDKVRTKERDGSDWSRSVDWIWDVWPLGGLYGVFSAAKGTDYLRKGTEKKSWTWF